MKKQKICIIGGSLAGLVTSISLSKLNCDIDLITDNSKNIYKSNRTIAISKNNLRYLNKLDISKHLNKEVWPCSMMKLYSNHKGKKFTEIFDINNTKDNKILYMIENSKIMKVMSDKIKKINSISVKKNKKIDEIYSSGLLKSIKLNNKNVKYNLVIICAGSDSALVKKIFRDQNIVNSYNEVSITTIINHSTCKNNIARQIFLDDEILALLPISQTKTSIVWSVKKNKQAQNDSLVKKKIKFYVREFLENVTFLKKIEYRNLNLLIRNKYYKNRILLFGDALHQVHPFVGQGFNMILRDLAFLEKIFYRKLSLGLDIGSVDILDEFSSKIKPSNFAFSIGVDLLKNSFSIKNKYFKDIRNESLKILNKNEFAKNIFINIADKGLKF